MYHNHHMFKVELLPLYVRIHDNLALCLNDYNPKRKRMVKKTELMNSLKKCNKCFIGCLE